MQSVRQGAIHLFRLAGVDLYLHWSWFLVAAYEIQTHDGRYSSIVWNVLEYLALFAIVLMHEFGHSLACRSVGGTADQIVLWPLGGVAYVNPPQRPGATLWSIAAGPLVNVALLPILYAAVITARSMGWPQALPDAYQLLRAILWIDTSLLIFNILPIYPLDGGQILRSRTLVCSRPRPQSFGRDHTRLHRHHRTCRRCILDAVHLDRRHLHLHGHELLERPASRPTVDKVLKTAASRRLPLPKLPNRSTARPLLAMQPLRSVL